VPERGSGRSDSGPHWPDSGTIRLRVNERAPTEREAVTSPADTPSAIATTEAPLNYSIFCTDIAGFTDPRRVVRDALYRILREAFDAANVPWTMCHHEDRGDGTLTLIPPTLPTMPLVDPLIALLAAKLKRHNRQAGYPVRIHLRAALHVGPIFHDANGKCGHALNYTARMLNAPILKQSLASTRANLAFIVSAHIYDTVVRHATGLVDHNTFQAVQVPTAESTTTGWMHLPTDCSILGPMPSETAASDPSARSSVKEPAQPIQPITKNASVAP